MIAINGNTKILGLIGGNPSKSKSFRMQNAAISALGLDAVYLPLIPNMKNPEEIRSILNIANFIGANVTVPYKELLLPILDELSPCAKAIGAINTIIKKDGKLLGDNTDWIGFLDAIDHYSLPWKDYPVYLLGAGGAAKAICFALQHLGVTAIHCWNRNPQKIQTLSPFLDVQYWDREHLPIKAIIIQCTPLGMQGETALPGIQFSKKHVYIDLIYNNTPTLNKANAQAKLAIDGMGMLVHQAAHSFSKWFGCPPPIQAMYQSLEHT